MVSGRIIQLEKEPTKKYIHKSILQVMNNIPSITVSLHSHSLHYPVFSIRSQKLPFFAGAVKLQLEYIFITQFFVILIGTYVYAYTSKQTSYIFIFGSDGDMLVDNNYAGSIMAARVWVANKFQELPKNTSSKVLRNNQGNRQN